MACAFGQQNRRVSIGGSVMVKVQAQRQCQGTYASGSQRWMAAHRHSSMQYLPGPSAARGRATSPTALDDVCATEGTELKTGQLQPTVLHSSGLHKLKLQRCTPEGCVHPKGIESLGCSIRPYGL